MTDGFLSKDSKSIEETGGTAKLLFQQLIENTLEQMRFDRSGHPAVPSKVVSAAQAFNDDDFDSLAVAGAIGSAIAELRSIQAIDFRFFYNSERKSNVEMRLYVPR